MRTGPATVSLSPPDPRLALTHSDEIRVQAIGILAVLPTGVDTRRQGAASSGSQFGNCQKSARTLDIVAVHVQNPSRLGNGHHIVCGVTRRNHGITGGDLAGLEDPKEKAGVPGGLHLHR